MKFGYNLLDGVITILHAASSRSEASFEGGWEGHHPKEKEKRKKKRKKRKKKK